ncbi:hypothetical protein RR48_09626 [Papilio machaon]|uniref:MADF domain-containing protein n=1 Tax=Papilio machaon TaxID=76193 RepID=A0A194QYF0_PAPMA|nr:hypothetical protein RR48_09626 [Papilio machaon]
MDNDKCRKLIQLYGANEFMWNSKSPQYHNKLLRLQTWVEISKQLDVPIPELKKKMTVLLASYRREKSRIVKSLSSGKGEVYVSKWYGFEDFQFMKDKDIANETLDTMVDNTQNDNNESNDTETSLPEEEQEIEPPKNPQKRRKTNIETDSPILRKHLKVRRRKKVITKEESPQQKQSFHVLTESATSTDLYFSYGLYIANELRKYDQRTLSYVKQAINNVIFEADIGIYSKLECDNRNDESYNSSTPSASPQPTISSPQFPDPLTTPKLEPKSSPATPTEDF